MLERKDVSSSCLWSPAAAEVQIRGLLRRIRVYLDRIWVGVASLLGSSSPSPVAVAPGAALSGEQFFDPSHPRPTSPFSACFGPHPLRSLLHLWSAPSSAHRGIERRSRRGASKWWACKRGGRCYTGQANLKAHICDY